jgi:hypothetical protein
MLSREPSVTFPESFNAYDFLRERSFRSLEASKSSTSAYKLDSRVSLRGVCQRHPSVSPSDHHGHNSWPTSSGKARISKKMLSIGDIERRVHRPYNNRSGQTLFPLRIVPSQNPRKLARHDLLGSLILHFGLSDEPAWSTNSPTLYSLNPPYTSSDLCGFRNRRGDQFLPATLFSTKVETSLIDITQEKRTIFRTSSHSPRRDAKRFPVPDFVNMVSRRGCMSPSRVTTKLKPGGSSLQAPLQCFRISCGQSFVDLLQELVSCVCFPSCT